MPTEVPLRTVHILRSIVVSENCRMNLQGEIEIPGLIPRFIVSDFVTVFSPEPSQKVFQDGTPGR